MTVKICGSETERARTAPSPSSRSSINYLFAAEPHSVHGCRPSGCLASSTRPKAKEAVTARVQEVQPAVRREREPRQAVRAEPCVDRAEPSSVEGEDVDAAGGVIPDP